MHKGLPVESKMNNSDQLTTYSVIYGDSLY